MELTARLKEEINIALSIHLIRQLSKRVFKCNNNDAETKCFHDSQMKITKIDLKKMIIEI